MPTHSPVFKRLTFKHYHTTEGGSSIKQKEKIMNEDAVSASLENESPEPVLNKGFFGWLDNFWYHYKWHTLITLFFVFFITLCSVQMCAKESYDVLVLYAGSAELDRNAKDGDIYTEYQLALDGLGRVCEDFDGNGEITVALKDLFLLTADELTVLGNDKETELNEYLLRENNSAFTDLLRSSDYYLCLMSEGLYKEKRVVDGYALFETLSPYVHEGTEVSFAGEDAIYLSSTAFSSLSVYNDLPADTVICLRKVSPLADKWSGNSAHEQHDRAAKVIEAIINYG